MGAKVPVYITKIIDHYRACWAEANRCIHCGDCIALAFSEQAELWLPRGGTPWRYGMTGEHAFVKFLETTISSEYLPCSYDRALPQTDITRFAKGLLRLGVDTRQAIRSLNFLAHSEFQEGDISLSSLHIMRGDFKKNMQRVLYG